MKEAMKVIVKIIGTLALVALTVVAVPVTILSFVVLPEMECGAISLIGDAYTALWNW